MCGYIQTIHLSIYEIKRACVRVCVYICACALQVLPYKSTSALQNVVGHLLVLFKEKFRWSSSFVAMDAALPDIDSYLGIR